MENAKPKLALLKPGDAAISRESAHPTPDELVAYHAQALSKGHCDQVQEHLAHCRECTQMVIQLAPAGSGMRRYNPLPDDHVSEAWERFVAQLAEGRAPDSPAPRRKPSHWVAGLAAIAAVLTVAAGAALVSLWALRGLDQPEINVNVIYPTPEEEHMRSVQAQAEAAPTDYGGSVLVVSPTEPYQFYRAEIEGLPGSGAVTPWSEDGLFRSKTGELTIGLPQGLFPAGTYQLRIFGLEGDKKKPLGIYHFPIGPQPEDSPNDRPTGFNPIPFTDN